MNIEDMNEGVRLLAQRMETNPEEFASVGRWRNTYEWLTGIVEMDHSFLHQEEIDYLRSKFREARRHNFTSDVLRALTQSDEPPQMVGAVGYGQPQQKQVLTRKGGALSGALSTGNGGTGATITASLGHEIKDYRDQMRALHQEFLKAQSNAVLEKKP